MPFRDAKPGFRYNWVTGQYSERGGSIVDPLDAHNDMVSNYSRLASDGETENIVNNIVQKNVNDYGLAVKLTSGGGIYLYDFTKQSYTLIGYNGVSKSQTFYASSDGGSSDRNYVEKTTDFLSSNGYSFGTGIAGIGLDFSGTSKLVNYGKVGVKYAGNIGTGVSVLVNTKDLVQGEITPGRYSYRMGGTGLAVLGGTVSGGIGLLIGVSVVGAEHVWDTYLVPLGQDIQYQFYRFQEGTKPSNWINY